MPRRRPAPSRPHTPSTHAIQHPSRHPSRLTPATLGTTSVCLAWTGRAHVRQGGAARQRRTPAAPRAGAVEIHSELRAPIGWLHTNTIGATRAVPAGAAVAQATVRWNAGARRSTPHRLTDPRIRDGRTTANKTNVDARVGRPGAHRPRGKAVLLVAQLPTVQRRRKVTARHKTPIPTAGRTGVRRAHAAHLPRTRRRGHALVVAHLQPAHW